MKLTSPGRRPNKQMILEPDVVIHIRLSGSAQASLGQQLFGTGLIDLNGLHAKAQARVSHKMGDPFDEKIALIVDRTHRCCFAVFPCTVREKHGP